MDSSSFKLPERLDLKGMSYCKTPTIRNANTAHRSYGACGKCEDCQRRRRAQWIGRLTLEHVWQVHHHGNECAIFLTLTYNQESLTDESLTKRDLELFWKRFRTNTRKSVRYFCSGEYGSVNGRKHWHCLVWGPNLRSTITRTLRPYSTGTSPKLETLDLTAQFTEAWQNGFVQLSTVNPQRIAYAAKYATKRNSKHEPQLVYSRMPGLGRPYLEYIARKLAKSCPSLKRVPSTYQVNGRRYSMGKSMSTFLKQVYLDAGGQINDDGQTLQSAFRCDFSLGWQGRIKRVTGIG